MSMGIYLPNMEMPENCICCDLSHEDGWCPAKQTYTDSYTFKTCPLIPVPPHGDLIDRDEMRETIKPWSPEDEMAGCTFDTVKKLMHTMISRAPVVIPAEEGE